MTAATRAMRRHRALVQVFLAMTVTAAGVLAGTQARADEETERTVRAVRPGGREGLSSCLPACLPASFCPLLMAPTPARAPRPRLCRLPPASSP